MNTHVLNRCLIITLTSAFDYERAINLIETEMVKIFFDEDSIFGSLEAVIVSFESANKNKTDLSNEYYSLKGLERTLSILKVERNKTFYFDFTSEQIFRLIRANESERGAILKEVLGNEYFEKTAFTVSHNVSMTSIYNWYYRYTK